MICPKCLKELREFKNKPYYTLWFVWKPFKEIYKTMEMDNHGKNWYCSNCGFTKPVRNTDFGQRLSFSKPENLGYCDIADAKEIFEESEKEREDE